MTDKVNIDGDAFYGKLEKIKNVWEKVSFDQIFQIKIFLKF